MFPPSLAGECSCLSTAVSTLYAQTFDPNIMMALFEMPVPDKEPGTVAQVLKTGYMLNDRVLRPADVGVVKKP